MSLSGIRFIITMPRVGSTTVSTEFADDEIANEIVDLSLALLQIHVVAQQRKHAPMRLSSPPDRVNRSAINIEPAPHAIETADQQTNSKLFRCNLAPPEVRGPPVLGTSPHAEVKRATDHREDSADDTKTTATGIALSSHRRKQRLAPRLGRYQPSRSGFPRGSGRFAKGRNRLVRAIG